MRNPDVGARRGRRRLRAVRTAGWVRRPPTTPPARRTTSDSMVSSCPPGASTSPASTTLTGCSGPGATVRPICSAISARSATPSPETLPPPSSSGTSRLAQPSSAARCHQSVSNETSVGVQFAHPAQRGFLVQERLRGRREQHLFGVGDVGHEIGSASSVIWCSTAASVPESPARSQSAEGVSGENERRHVGLVDDLVRHLEQVDHVAAHDLSDALRRRGRGARGRRPG